MTIEAPSDLDNLLFLRASSAATITRADCVVDAVATTVYTTIQKCDGNGRNCSTTVASGTCADTMTALSIASPAIADADVLRIDLGTVLGSPGHLLVCLTFQ